MGLLHLRQVGAGGEGEEEVHSADQVASVHLLKKCMTYKRPYIGRDTKRDPLYRGFCSVPRQNWREGGTVGTTLFYISITWMLLVVFVVALREDKYRVVQLPPRLMSKKKGVLTFSIMGNIQRYDTCGGLRKY